VRRRGPRRARLPAVVVGRAFAAAGLDLTTVEPLGRGGCDSPARTPPSSSSSRRSAGRGAELDPATTWRGRAAWRATSSRCACAAAPPSDGRAQRDRRPRAARALWGAPDWDRIELARTVSAWLGDDLAVSLTAIRPAGKRDHAVEAVAASIIERGEDGEPRRARRGRSAPVDDLRRRRAQRRAGLELWDRRRRLAAPRGGRDRLRHVARPRAPSPGLRLLPLADGGSRGLRALRRAAPGP
jgi:hypothetical protein